MKLESSQVKPKSFERARKWARKGTDVHGCKLACSSSFLCLPGCDQLTCTIRSPTRLSLDGGVGNLEIWRFPGQNLSLARVLNENPVIVVVRS